MLCFIIIEYRHWIRMHSNASHYQMQNDISELIKHRVADHTDR